jgi:hypothetical protein
MENGVYSPILHPCARIHTIGHQRNSVRLIICSDHYRSAFKILIPPKQRFGINWKSTHISRQAGLGRESLYKALSPEGNPEFATILKVIKALGLQLHVVPTEHPGLPGEESNAFLPCHFLSNHLDPSEIHNT